MLTKGINVKKKHQKPTKEQKGGIVSIEKPVHLSNLKIIDGKKSQEKSKKQDTKKKTETKAKKIETKTKKTAVKKKVTK